MSLGHLRRTGRLSQPVPYDRMASTVAMAAMYCRKTMGREAARCAGWLMTVDMMRQPAGASHTLVPRPRPATCVVAVAVKPVGSFSSSFGFLFLCVSRPSQLASGVNRGRRGEIKCTSPGWCSCSS